MAIYRNDVVMMHEMEHIRELEEGDTEMAICHLAEYCNSFNYRHNYKYNRREIRAEFVGLLSAQKYFETQNHGVVGGMFVYDAFANAKDAYASNLILASVGLYVYPDARREAFDAHLPDLSIKAVFGHDAPGGSNVRGARFRLRDMYNRMYVSNDGNVPDTKSVER